MILAHLFDPLARLQIDRLEQRLRETCTQRDQAERQWRAEESHRMAVEGARDDIRRQLRVAQLGWGDAERRLREHEMAQTEKGRAWNGRI